MKGTVFNEMKSKINKDRGTLRQIVKTLDFKGDKQLVGLMK
jgi:hypothetical protein